MRTFNARLLAFMIDWVVLFVVFVSPQLAIMVIAGKWFLNEDSSNVLTWAWVAVSVSLPSLVYFTLCDLSPSGMTVGKRLMKIAVRSVGENRISPGRALLRNAVKLVPWELTHIMIFFPEPFSDKDPSTGKVALMVLSTSALLIWLIVPLLDKPRYRALHDRVAGTTVYGLDEAKNLSERL